MTCFVYCLFLFLCSEGDGWRLIRTVVYYYSFFALGGSIRFICFVLLFSSMYCYSCDCLTFLISFPRGMAVVPLFSYFCGNSQNYEGYSKEVCVPFSLLRLYLNRNDDKVYMY